MPTSPHNRNAASNSNRSRFQSVEPKLAQNPPPDAAGAQDQDTPSDQTFLVLFHVLLERNPQLRQEALQLVEQFKARTIAGRCPGCDRQIEPNQ